MNRHQVIEPSSYLVITADYLRTQIKQAEITAENELLETFIKTATRTAEKYCGLRFMETELADYHTEWCNRFVFWNAGNVISIESIEYMADGSTSYTTLAASNYYTDLNADPSGLVIHADTLPDLNDDHPECIKITYKAGYGSVGDDETTQRSNVLIEAKQAITLLAAHWYMYRTDYAKKEMPSAAISLLNQIKCSWV